MTKSKKYMMKLILSKAIENPPKFKNTYFFQIQEHHINGVNKCKNKKCGVRSVKIEGQSYIFKDSKIFHYK